MDGSHKLHALVVGGPEKHRAVQLLCPTQENEKKRYHLEMQ